MISPAYSFTTRTLLVYAVGLAVLAGLYGAYVSRASQMAGLSAQPFAPSLPNLTEVDTTEAADQIKASGIGRVVDPNAPNPDNSGPDTVGDIDPENAVPRISAVVVENGEPYAYVRTQEGFLKLAVGETVRSFHLIALSPSKAEFRKSDGDVSTQIFFSAAD
jgi:hypothetical protein